MLFQCFVQIYSASLNSNMSQKWLNGPKCLPNAKQQVLNYSIYQVISMYCCSFLHCTVEKKRYFAQLSAAVKIDLGLEIQSLSKRPFLNVFSKMYCPTNVDVLGNWEVRTLFKNVWRFFFVLYRGTLN